MASQRHVTVGGVQIGGGAPVAVQTMTKTETANLAATMAQIRTVADAGADVVRVAVPREKDVEALKTIVKESPVPVIADNSGSLPKHLHELERESPVEALVTAGVEFVHLMERLEFTDFKVSIKSTNVPYTIAANRLLSEKIPYPLHLGITEAGTKWSGSLKS